MTQEQLGLTDWLALPCCRHMQQHDMERRVCGLTGKKTWEVGF